MTDPYEALHSRVPGGRNLISLSDPSVSISFDFIMYMWSCPFRRCDCCDGQAYHFDQEEFRMGPFTVIKQTMWKCDKCDDNGMAHYLCLN